MRIRISFTLLLLAGIVAACATGSTPVSAAPPLRPIAALDVPRYMGGWYEIAKFPNWFQRACVADTKAEYTPGTDGQVVVTNRCRDKAGETLEAIGAARQIGAPDSPKLEVRFAPAWLAVIPVLWADYWVIDIDERYQLAAVSEPRRKYLWILSRTPQVDAKAYDALLARLQAQGFDLTPLTLTPQAMR